MLRSLVNYIDESCMAFQSVLLCLLKLCAAETIMLSLCRAVCPNLHHRFSHAHRIALPMRVRHAAHYNLLQLIWALQTSSTELPASSLGKPSLAKL